MIVDRGLAYAAPSGVYFDVQAFGSENYGHFGRGAEGGVEPRTEGGAGGGAGGARQSSRQSEKKDPRDFALWKTNEGSSEVGWDSPWGFGRPGWHIECSALTHSIYGHSLQMHSGFRPDPVPFSAPSLSRVSAPGQWGGVLV